ncbi:MAG TPA: hypothetical protein VNO26_08990 [Candidatus Limnocylindria bacterium]|nr:hypothetical protein [Candidatus Limnocylindria bacterium]
MLEAPSTLVSIDAQALAAAAVCVGASLLLASVAAFLQRRPQLAWRPGWMETLAERVHLVRHAT